MLKMWLIKTFCKKRILLENILLELRNIHHHLDRLDAFYMVINKIKEDKEKIMVGGIVIKKRKREEMIKNV